VAVVNIRIGFKLPTCPGCFRIPSLNHGKPH
jgi:hypothetical protein